MLKNPEEYDRRMEEIDKRRLDLQKERESREANMHRLVDERSKYLYTPPSSSLNTPMNRSRESSISRDQVSSTSSKTAKSHVTFDTSSKSDVYSRNRVTRYTPGTVHHIFSEILNCPFFSFYENKRLYWHLFVYFDSQTSGNHNK